MTVRKVLSSILGRTKGGDKMEWNACEDGLPELTDDSVLVYFSETKSIETVHRQDYFADITAGVSGEGKQLYTKWYLSQKVTHWMELPDPPQVG